MKKLKQLTFFNDQIVNQFGGELLVGRRKSARPLSTKKPIHLILRADTRKLLSHETQIYKLLNRFAKKFGITIYKRSVNTTHIHLVIKLHRRESYAGFVRAVCGQISEMFIIKWLHRPFTRIAEWGHDFKSLLEYVFQNQLEASGVISYRPRKLNVRNAIKRR